MLPALLGKIGMRALRGHGYYVLLAISGALALLAQIPGVLLIAMMLLILPGLALLVGSNVFIYMLALTPAWRVLTAKRRNARLVLPALLPAIAVAFLPKEYADRSFAAIREAATRSDFSQPAGLKPTSVAILTEGGGGNCDVLCEKLLFEGHVSVVTTSGKRFTIEKRESCPDVTNGNRRLMMQAAAGNCLISTTGAKNVHAADVVVRKTDVREQYDVRGLYASEDNRLQLFTINEMMQYDVFEAGKPVERSTHIVGETATAPFLMSMGGSGMALDGWAEIARTEHKINNESLEAMLQLRYGWKLVDLEPSAGGSFHINEAPVDMAVFDAVLARSQKPGAEVSEADGYALAQGVRQITAKPVLEEADIARIRAVMRLPNMRAYGEFIEETREWRPQYATLIPDAVARIEQPYVENDYFATNMFSFLAGAPRELVLPYMPRLEAAMASPRGESAGRMFRVLHEMSPNAAAILIPWTRHGEEGGIRQVALEGLCKAAAPGREDIAQAFRDYLQRSYDRNTIHFEPWPAIAGLVRASSVEDAQRVTAYPDEERRQNIARPFSIAMGKPWPKNCGLYA